MTFQPIEGTLDDDRGHVVHYSCHGNPDGPAILSFHGGPGSKSSPDHVRRFDEKKYRIILFDQRGCGKSTPSGKTESNTTLDTLADAERIREKLGIERWFVSGSSWGSTLSFLYAIHYPQRVRGILVSSFFLADRDTVSWAMEDPNGVARLVPEIWERRMTFFDRYGIGLKTQNADLTRLFATAQGDELKNIVAGVVEWESNISSVQSEFIPQDPKDITDEDIASARIFTHYELNHAFLPDNFILDGAKSITSTPVLFVHGRYDILCPMQKAYELAKRFVDAEFVVVSSSGHSFSVEGEAIRRLAYDRFLARHS